MSNVITINTGKITVQAELNTSRIARALLGILPVKSTVNTWGDEIYFDVPLNMQSGKSVPLRVLLPA